MPVYRVNYLRAKARRDRWKEEKEKLQYEIVWVREYFKSMKLLWEGRAIGGVGFGRGYAARRSREWELLEEHATNARRAAREIVNHVV